MHVLVWSNMYFGLVCLLLLVQGPSGFADFIIRWIPYPIAFAVFFGPVIGSLYCLTIVALELWSARSKPRMAVGSPGHSPNRLWDRDLDV
jgi:hypothetical protein